MATAPTSLLLAEAQGEQESSGGAGRGKDNRGSSNRLADVWFSLHLSAQVLQSPSCCCGGPACSVPLQLPAQLKPGSVWVTAEAGKVLNPAEARPRGDAELAVLSVGETHFCVSQMQTKEHF